MLDSDDDSDDDDDDDDNLKVIGRDNESRLHINDKLL